MNSPRSRTTAFRMLALLATSAALLAACSPTAELTPTPTPAFANEAEAFAAAEEVYRAYLDAAAARADGETNSGTEDFLSGDALEADVQAQRNLQHQGVRIVGPTIVERFTEVEADVSQELASVVMDVCVDISDSRVIDESGVDVTPAGRPDRGSMTVEFSGTPARLLIVGSSPNEDVAC